MSVNSTPSPGPAPEPKKSKAWIFALVAFILVAATWGALVSYAGSSIGFWKAPTDQPISSLGQFGDTFGSLNTLFAGLAFIGVVFTLYRQIEEGKDDEERFKHQRDQQARMTLIQGLTTLLNIEQDRYLKKLDGIHYFETLHHLTLHANSYSHPTKVGEVLAEIDEKRRSSVMHFTQEGQKALDELFTDFRDSITLYKDTVRRIALGEEQALSDFQHAERELTEFLDAAIKEGTKIKEELEKSMFSHRGKIAQLMKEEEVSIGLVEGPTDDGRQIQSQ